MASGLYNIFFYRQAIAQMNFQTNDLCKVALVDDTYVFDKDHDTWETGSDPFNSEVVGAGYAAGGVTLGQGTVTQVDASDLVKLDAPNTVFSGITVTARFAIVYIVSGVYLVFCFDFGSNQTVSDGDLTLNYNAAGIVTLAQVA
jgi:hypothetical protein